MSSTAYDSTTYAYDPSGNVTSATDVRNGTQTELQCYTYDAFIKMCGEPVPDSADEREARLRQISARKSSKLSERFDQGASRVQQLLDDAQPT